MSESPVEFYFEFGSPYGYFASHEIDEICAKYNRKTIWKPFMLGSAFKQTGAKPLLNVPLKGDYCVHDWQRMSQYTGVPFVLPKQFPTGLLAPSRAYYWLVDQGEDLLAKKLAKASYKAYFADQRPVWEVDEAAIIAEECGVNHEDFQQAINNPDVKRRLIEEGEKATGKGVFGSPFVIADGEAFWGWDRFPLLQHWLENGKW